MEFLKILFWVTILCSWLLATSVFMSLGLWPIGLPLMIVGISALVYWFEQGLA